MYLNKNLKVFESVEDLLAENGGKDLQAKILFNRDVSLQIFDNNKLLGEIDDIQPLYLFPATILDYVDAWLEVKDKKRLLPTKISICDFEEFDFKSCFEVIDTSKLKHIELIVDSSAEKYFEKIEQVVEFANKNNVKVSLLANGFEKFSEDFLKKITDDICYFKIMLSNILHKIEYSEFLKKLNVICKNKDAVVHIKAYLNEEQSEFYKKAICDFENLGVQIFQVSKELIAIGAQNVSVSQIVQKLIRELEKTYDGKNGIKFLSVKDISTLFYPRFELDERNSRNCYACVLKPYIYGNKILPCKVQKVIENKDDWKVFDTERKETKNIVKYGRDCDDCASMFENDILGKIENLVEGQDVSNLTFAIKVR